MIKSQQENVVDWIQEHLSQLDLFSMPPTIKVLKQDKFRTKIGLIFTLAIITLITIYLYTVLNDVFNYPYPVIVQTEYGRSDLPPISLRKSNFTLVVALQDLNLTKFGSIGTVFNIMIQNCFKSTNQNEQICKTYPVQQCSMEHHFVSDYQKQYFALLNLTHSYCIDSDAWDANPPVLEGTTAVTNVSYMTVTVTQCVNDTMSQKCAPQSVIDSTLASYYYTIYMSDSLINMNSLGQPFTPAISQSYMVISNKNSLYLSDPRRVTMTATDKGIIMQDFVYNQTMIQTLIRQTLSSYNNQYLVLHIILFDQKQTLYSRSYQKLQQALGNVGGLFQLLFFVTQILVSPIIRLMMNIELANKIFSFFQDSMPDDKKLKHNIFKVHEIGQIRTKMEIQNFLQAKKRSFSLTSKEILFLLCGCRRSARKQINYATKKISKKLDVEYFLFKLFEIEKLKSILLTKEQLQVFNYLQKPSITPDLFSKGNEELLKKLEADTQYNYLIQEETSDYEKLIQAYHAYLLIRQSKNEIDQSLLSNLDQEIVELFTSMSGGHTKLNLNATNIHYIQEDKIDPNDNNTLYQDRNSRQALQDLNIVGDLGSLVY